MASNPIKRRARQSFFLGFLIALVIMAVIVLFLYTKISSLNEENAKLVELSTKGAEVMVYTVDKDIEIGEPLTEEDLRPASMKLVKDSTAIGVNDYVSPEIFYGYDAETGEDVDITYTARVKLLEGTVVTLSMLEQGGMENSERMMEYSMIVLPTQLVNGDYIDVRLRTANGTDTIILPKKKVEQCTTTSVWMKMSEIEILTMNSAIVDCYRTEGSQLRATVYTNPLMQDAAKQTYPVNDEVLQEIIYSPNILADAINDLTEKWMTAHDANAGASDFRITRRTLDSSMTVTGEDIPETIQEGYDAEAESQAEARDQYVSELDGTGMVGVSY
ncbi:MAG: hypothetical protein IJ867_03340 [Clostridia bacterium]|nr:hypothetical protein [Clostridia bacterium]